MAGQDFRARLQPKSMSNCEDILGIHEKSNILFPLFSTNGVLFPYTPEITSGYVADYDPTAFVHSIYGYNAYIRSYPKSIEIKAEFTAQTNNEAIYLLAVLHFFRAVTKSYFGVSQYKKAGTPPPVLLFNYMGDYQFNNVPVIIKSFDYVYPADINYVAVNTGTTDGYGSDYGVSLPIGKNGGYTLVPTHTSISLTLDTQYTPVDLRNNFDLDAFRSGTLITGGYL